MSTRAAIIASWKAAQRHADVHGAIVLNPASAAGQVLDTYDGNAGLAYEDVVRRHGEFWGHVAEVLERVVDEETGKESRADGTHG